MRITIKTIPHVNQRYNTCGDWEWTPEGSLIIYVSETPRTGPNGSLLIGIHELIEAVLCRHSGISTKMVDDFDLTADPTSDVEPGDMPHCPYHEQHCIATGTERLLAALLHVQWTKYEEELNELTEAYATERRDYFE